MSKEEIMTFASQYDPQYFHVDEERAKHSPFGEVIASGFHTIGKVWSEWVKMDVLGEDCLGGLSANEIRWWRPVFAGDYLYATIKVAEKKSMKGKGRGVITLAFDVKNQTNKTVLTFVANVLIASLE